MSEESHGQNVLVYLRVRTNEPRWRPVMNPIRPPSSRFMKTDQL